MKKATMVALGLAVGFVAGYGTGRVSTGTPINPLLNGKGSYEEGYAAAAKKLEESGLVPKAPEQTLILGGRISAVTEESFTLEADAVSPNPLREETGPKQRTVRVTDKTKILIMTQRTPQEMAEEEEAFRKALNAGEQPIPPSPTALKPYDAALATGDAVYVEAASDILNAKEFEAVTVTVVKPLP